MQRHGAFARPLVGRTLSLILVFTCYLVHVVCANQPWEDNSLTVDVRCMEISGSVCQVADSIEVEPESEGRLSEPVTCPTLFPDPPAAPVLSR